MTKKKRPRGQYWLPWNTAEGWLQAAKYSSWFRTPEIMSAAEIWKHARLRGVTYQQEKRRLLRIAEALRGHYYV